MTREGFGFAASIIGGVLLVLGLYGYTPEWVTLVGGAAVAACSLLTLGGWGASLLFLSGIWMLASTWIGWARRPWNLIVFGIAIVSLGFLAGALSVAPPTFGSAGDTGD